MSNPGSVDKCICTSFQYIVTSKTILTVSAEERNCSKYTIYSFDTLLLKRYVYSYPILNEYFY